MAGSKETYELHRRYLFCIANRAQTSGRESFQNNEFLFLILWRWSRVLVSWFIVCMRTRIFYLLFGKLRFYVFLQCDRWLLLRIRWFSSRSRGLNDCKSIRKTSLIHCITTNDWPDTLFCFLFFGPPSAFLACFNSHFLFFSSFDKAPHVWMQATLKSRLNSCTGFKKASLLFGSRMLEEFSVWRRKPSGTMMSDWAIVYRRRLKEREKAIVQVKRRRGREELDRKAERILSDYFRGAP